MEADGCLALGRGDSASRKLEGNRDAVGRTAREHATVTVQSPGAYYGKEPQVSGCLLALGSKTRKASQARVARRSSSEEECVSCGEMLGWVRRDC